MRFSASVASRRSLRALSVVHQGSSARLPRPLTLPSPLTRRRAPPSPTRGEGLYALLAGQTLVVVGALELIHRGFGGVVGLDPAREAGALHRFRAEVIER